MLPPGCLRKGFRGCVRIISAVSGGSYPGFHPPHLVESLARGSGGRACVNLVALFHHVACRAAVWMASPMPRLLGLGLGLLALLCLLGPCTGVSLLSPPCVCFCV